MGKLGTLQEKEHTQSLEKRVQGVLAARVFYSDTFLRPASVCQVGVQAGAGLGFMPPTSHAGPKNQPGSPAPQLFAHWLLIISRKELTYQKRRLLEKNEKCPRE